MPATKERRQLNVINRARFGSGAASGAYTQFDGDDGWLSQSGCARAYKEIYLGPVAFNVQVANASGVGASGLLGACNAGSLFSSCVIFDITGSAFGGGAAGSNMGIPALNMGVGASPASPLTAVAFFSKPIDADTSGSIIAFVEWTNGITPATTGSKINLSVALGYFGGFATTPSGVRTAASAGGVGSGSYSGTACGLFQSTCVGKLPSFTASDSAGVLVLQVGASAGADSGKLDTGCTFILGVRLRYLTNVRGLQSTE